LATGRKPQTAQQAKLRFAENTQVPNKALTLSKQHERALLATVAHGLSFSSQIEWFGDRRK
jgi:hypothetical protein